MVQASLLLLVLLLLLLVLLQCPGVVDSFIAPPPQRIRAPSSSRRLPLFLSSSPSGDDVEEVDDDELDAEFESFSQTLVEDEPAAAQEVDGTTIGSNTATTPSSASSSSTSIAVLDCAVADENTALKTRLLRLAAMYDRGLGVSSNTAQEQADEVIGKLEQCDSAARNAAATILSSSISSNSSNSNSKSPSLIGTWRLIWTTALDVVSLQASPVLTVGAIHQVYEASRVVTNVIDFVPRAQSLFPSTVVPPSLLRARVTTRACEPTNPDIHPNRVGLVFEQVAVQPQQLLGVDVGQVLPPLSVDLPRLPDSLTAAAGYFDVTYLDRELLIIRQNAPGGLFALLRVDSLDAA